jgi:hypothetical protein
MGNDDDDDHFAMAVEAESEALTGLLYSVITSQPLSMVSLGASLTALARVAARVMQNGDRSVADNYEMFVAVLDIWLAVFARERDC